VSVNKSAPPPQAGSAEGLPTPHAGPTGTVEVVEVLEDHEPNKWARYAQALVTYENDTDRTFETVQIWCRAFDGGGWALGAQSWSLSSSLLGPIESGFRMREIVRIQVDPGAVVDRIECRITDAYAAGG
jgi:hypothetical protein